MLTAKIQQHDDVSSLSSIDSSGAAETFWYGRYNNGYSLYVPGSVMTLKYEGVYSEPGFQLVYYPADPGILATVFFFSFFLIPKLAIVVLGVHYEPLNSNQP